MLPKTHSKKDNAKTFVNEGQEAADQCISRHIFNQKIEFVIPTEIVNLITLPTFSYYQVNLSISDILKDEFISKNVSASERYALGWEGDDRFCLNGKDKLVMDICKDTYERLGLIGREAKFGNKRRIIEIDLNNITKRQRWCFDNTYKKKITFFINFKMDSAIQMDCSPIITLLNDIKIPPIESIFESNTQMECLEWLGMVSLEAKRLKLSDNVDPFISCYEVMDSQIGSVAKITWTGFFTPHLIKEILMKFESSPWFIITVWGFENAPISWLTRSGEKYHEHSYTDLGNGENLYSIWTISSKKCILFEIVCGDTLS